VRALKIAVSFVAVTTTLALTACGPNCQSTCNRLYSSGSNSDGVEDCSISRPGRSDTDLIDTCLTECEQALSEPGEIGAYDPFVQQGSNTSIELENERQAALWMECIEEQSCQRLSEGYCAPVK
jgi:hypothetical protein